MLWTLVGIVLLICFAPLAIQILWEFRWFVLAALAGFGLLIYAALKDG